MRLVAKNLNDKPVILSAIETLKLLETLSQAAAPLQIKDNYFQGPYKDAEGRTQSRVRDKLNEYYFEKCAYCETYCKAHIEHYRPKKGVTEDKDHSGYYWLCYEWSNLIPSCPDCNTFGGKGNQFPIQGIRVTAPQFKDDGTLDKTHSQASSTYLLTEQPYLLHPELDEPILYLRVELDPVGEGLKLTGVDASQRGEQTIRVCNLNRKNLKVERLSVLDTFVREINNMFKLVADGQLSSENLAKALFLCFEQFDDDKANHRLSHTFLRRFIMENSLNFDAVVLPRLISAQKAIVQDAFAFYIQDRIIQPN